MRCLCAQPRAKGFSMIFDCVDADVFQCYLDHLAQSIPKPPNKRRLLILDNASCHKAERLWLCLKADHFADFFAKSGQELIDHLTCALNSLLDDHRAAIQPGCGRCGSLLRSALEIDDDDVVTVPCPIETGVMCECLIGINAFWGGGCCLGQRLETTTGRTGRESFLSRCFVGGKVVRNRRRRSLGRGPFRRLMNNFGRATSRERNQWSRRKSE